MEKDSALRALPMPKITESDKWRFWAKVILTCNPFKCWNWTGNVDRAGYGKIGIRPEPFVSRTIKANRLAFYLGTGIDPVGNVVMHTCDNPSCVNPNHLKLGTTQDNVDDKMRKGRFRAPRGSECSSSKLTEAQVMEIREKCNAGMMQKDVAPLYGVGQRAISKIVTGVRWKHIL